VKVTKSLIDKISAPKIGQVFYRDDLLRGFAVRVTASLVKSFIIEKRIDGKVKRITIGRYPDLTVEQARQQGQKLLGKIASGIDPVAEKKATKQRALTLQQAFEDYLKARKSIKPSTIKDYQYALNQVCPDWVKKPLLSITKDMITKRHTRHGDEHSEARANLAMRILRAIFNFAMGEYENEQGRALILENPIKRLSHTRAWYRVERRQTIIKQHDLAKWYEGLQQLTHRYDDNQAEMMKDYFLLVLFTGLRREEAARLVWENIDFKAKTLSVRETKNNQSHTLPLSDFLYDLLKRRKQNAITDYVFASTGKAGYINDSRKALYKIRELSEVDFTIHDLRRTFITMAESLDIPVYALKRLLNHKMSTDVTAGYVIMDIERLRKPMQLITDTLLKWMGVKQGAEVVEFSAKVLKGN
jgi:integrase